MKASASVARDLATTAGVPSDCTIHVQDWNLSSCPDRDAKIAALAQTLPANGVAYLEYDAYPGFRFHEVLRDIVGYHCRGVQDLKERREQAMAILGFVANCGQADWIREFVKGEIERLQSSNIEDFDFEFDPNRHPFRQFELTALVAPHGLRCWFEQQHLHGNGIVFIGRGTENPPEEREPNALYHDVVYPQFLHAGLHPERLETMARIFGLTPAPAQNCRVLELGCGQGITMLNCASDLQATEFVGIDFAQIQIDVAVSTGQQLGLKNAKFLAMDITQFDASLGKFDYIVAHGMYSWLPEPIRKKMLDICRDHLTDHGIAYFCFNTRPGYRFPGMIRDVGLDAVSGKVRDLQDAEVAMNRMKTLSIDEEMSPGRVTILRPCLEHFSKSAFQNAIFDEMADVNTPFLFDEFATEANEFGLQFFAESDIKNWSTKTLHPNAQQLLDGLLEDPVRRIQYRDLLYLTRFHSSLLCRSDRKPAYSPLPAMIEQMLFTMRGKPASANPDVRGETSELFTGPGGVEVNIADPLLKAALVVLYLEHPVRYPFDRLLQEASELAAVPPDADKLRRWLQPLWETGFLDIHSHMPAIVMEPGDRPVAHHLARLCALEMRKVPSLLGVGAEMEDDTDAALLQLLDGSRDREDLERELGLNHDELQSRLNALARLGLLTA